MPASTPTTARRGHIKGDPTDPAVLRARRCRRVANALVAGTSVDIDNLAIVLAARELNKSLFIVARQTQRRNSSVFRAAPADLVMLSGYVVAAEVLRVIRAPQLATFLRRARDEDEDWAGGAAGAHARGHRRRGRRVVVDRTGAGQRADGLRWHCRRGEDGAAGAN